MVNSPSWQHRVTSNILFNDDVCYLDVSTYTHLFNMLHWHLLRRVVTEIILENEIAQLRRVLSLQILVACKTIGAIDCWIFIYLLTFDIHAPLITVIKHIIKQQMKMRSRCWRCLSYMYLHYEYDFRCHFSCNMNIMLVIAIIFRIYSFFHCHCFFGSILVSSPWVSFVEISVIGIF